MTLTDSDIDHRYFSWLCTMAGVRPKGVAAELLRQLYLEDFKVILPMDHNRSDDGISLRHRFAFETCLVDVSDEWLSRECTFLEMIIALSDRLGLQIDMYTDSSFWHIMRNLGLNKFSDVPDSEIHEIVDRINNREYRTNGHGGLFPLKVATRDQRELEIHSQMQDYILELDL